VYDLNLGDYVAFDPSGWSGRADEELGKLPEVSKPWKALLMDRNKEEVLEEHFSALRASDQQGAQLAMEYLKSSKSIGEGLVKDGVANTPEDVNGVLMNGFYHLYGPINEYTG
jgi:hypothetical protein